MPRLRLRENLGREEARQGSRALARSLTRPRPAAQQTREVGCEGEAGARGAAGGHWPGAGPGGRQPGAARAELAGVHTLGQQRGRQLLLGHRIGLTWYKSRSVMKMKAQIFF